MRELKAGERPALARGQTAVIVAAEGGGEQLSRCLAALERHTPGDVALGVIEEPAGVQAVSELLDAAAPADVIVLSASVVVGAGWLGRLRAAATSDSTIAAAAPLVTDSGFLGIEPRDDGEIDRIAEAVAEAAPHPRPRTPPLGASCVYVRREALELVGGLDAASSDVRFALADLVCRCIAQGLQQVAADDVIVFDDAPWDPSVVAERHPWVTQATELASTGVSRALSRSRASARRAADGLAVTIDARIVRDTLSGTQLHVLELAAAVTRTRRARVRLLVSPELSGEPAALLDQIDAERLPVAELSDATERSGVVHRPNQVFSLQDLEILGRVGERLVVSHQDLIAYRNPEYHAMPERWEQYRHATRLTLASADAVVFSSRHSLDDALADDLVDPGRCSVIPVGLDHKLGAASASPERPRRLGVGKHEGFLLCLGTDYMHKNVVFALRVFAALRDYHGWRGNLVLAGPHMDHGSSADEQRRWLDRRTDLAPLVEHLGPVTEAEKAWLIANASAVLYPTAYEGFGLVPFEAAAAGTPCLWAPQASLNDVLPPREAPLVPWDERASAERALPLLRDAAARAEHVNAVNRAAALLPDWDAHAEALLEVYERAARRPYREAVVLAREAPEREAELARWYDLKEKLGDEGFGLVRPDGYLPFDIQIALLSIVTRPRLREPFFAALRAIYRAGHRVSRGDDGGRK